MVSFSHRDQGTEEKEWAASGLAALAELPLEPHELSAMRFVLLAAHPDDETLGAGGLLALLHSLGADVEVLLCTAGEGSHPDSATMTPKQLVSFTPKQLASFTPKQVASFTPKQIANFTPKQIAVIAPKTIF